MSLTASMWSSVSGLLAHGEKMNVIGNNISNVNTVGFKAQRMDFEDFVYQYVGTANGMGQVGRGTNVGIIMNDFSQGATESTTSATDIAITGNGFFCVKPLNNNVSYYTRAGNFTFNKDGYLVDPHGYVLQGWTIDRNSAGQVDPLRSGSGIIGTGSPVDVKLDTFSCPPRHTTNITLPVNLRYDTVAATDDKSSDITDPFFSLLKNWDATQTPPLGTDQRAYQSTMEVYDEGGRLHKLTIYFDRVANDNPTNIDGYTDGESYWEFIVTMEPSEDLRDFSSEYDPTGMSPTIPNVPDKLKGLLAAGTMTFSSSGTMKDMSCFVPQGSGDAATSPETQWWDANGNLNLTNWIAAPISSNGYPMIAPNFSGTAGLQNAYGYDENGDLVTNSPNINGSDRMIALDFGIKLKGNSWAFITSTNDQSNYLRDLAAIAGNSDGLDANGYPLDKNGNRLDTGGAMWYIPSRLTNDNISNSRAVDANGNNMSLYQVDEFGDGSSVYYTTERGAATPPSVKTTIAALYKVDDDSIMIPSGPGATAGIPSAADVGTSKYHGNGMDGLGVVNEGTSSKCRGDSFYEYSGAKQDGYTYGDLRYVQVSTDGVLSAAYSNGVTLQLYQIVLYDFPSTQNLRREGGNLFTETRESGVPNSGAAGTGTFGTTKGSFLEQSNVDLSREFVNMITTQRGFQANSKTITTVDTMLETVIGMKR
ncbi:flagellar hook-basal body complex protein [Desulfovibrio sp. OttesenSCG-928-A18]|nr:flagellar hook-basal body complex protein [Desulfovibrio sp. OttesenSCG-928-A18]